MQFIGSGNETHVTVRILQVADVFDLSRLPGRLGIGIGVRATFHDVSDPGTEEEPDFLEHWLATAIFDDVMEQRRDGKIFISASFEHESRDAHEVSNVGDCSLLALLVGVHARCIEEGFVEVWAEGRFRSPDSRFLGAALHDDFSPRRIRR
jgi:hypothetical protein